ncbi:MAG TPA: TonB-dependent receptor [Sphingopyxis sp.]|nr:TonB-dependent receptor [Sphingopyxis sp.]HMP45656.1 TonB-dependent receptor [Sphingopyxis sp.]HMQ18040.1 TonB-dependent receptor [Sphingopyxis sp.]
MKLAVRATALAGVGLAAMLAGQPALAQDGSAAQEANSDDGVIVVTAQRRAESINDVGIAIQAFSGDTLQDLRVTSTEDLQAVVPSLNVARGYQGIPIYTLRGIGFNTINLSATSTVGTYQDEVALAYPFMNSGPIYDLERVEVLKGPQGTLYGRNTTGGLVNFITAKPKFGEFSGGVTVEAGSHQTLNSEAFVNVPLGDAMALRAAFRTEDSWRGWQKSATRDERLGEVHRYGARLTLTAEPVDGMKIELGGNFWINKSDSLAGQAVGFTPNTDPANGTLFSLFNAAGLPAFVAANGGNWDSNSADWAPLPVRGPNIGRGTGIDGPLREDSDFLGLRGLIQFDLTGDLSFISLTGYNRVKRDARYDWSGAPYEILIQHAVGKIESFSQELRFQGSTGPAEWVVGGYYAKDVASDTNQTLLGQNANVGAIRALILQLDLLNTPFNSPGYTAADVATAFRTYRDVADFDTETFSLFASADWQLADTLKLTTGVRYTEDRQEYQGCSRDLDGSMLPNVNLFNRAFFFQVYGAFTAPIAENQCNTFDVDTGTFGLVTSTLKEDNVAWRGALTWDPADDVLVYASVSRGYKSGSTPVNAANIATQNRPAKQEQLTAYEVGTKLALADRRVNLNLAGFYYDYRDKQLAVYFADPIYTTLQRLDNIPKSRAYGIDGDVSIRAADSLTLNLAGTWLRTEIQGYVGINAAGQAFDFDGFAFPYSPEFSGAATITYDAPVSGDLGIRAILNGRYQTRTSSTIEEFAPLAIKAHGLLNASLAVYDRDGKWEASIWGRNITDSYYWMSAATNANTAVRFPGRSATWGVTAKVNF